MKSVYLIGFMGSGKTSVAQQLAAKLKMPLVDTDVVIEENNKISIPEIFSNYGERTFREFEHRALIEQPTEDTIISTGGGIVETKANTKWLERHGTVIYLETSWEEVVQRLKNDSSRPLWNNDQLNKKKLFERRASLYKDAASIIICTDKKTPEEIANEIITLI